MPARDPHSAQPHSVFGTVNTVETASCDHGCSCEKREDRAAIHVPVEVIAGKYFLLRTTGIPGWDRSAAGTRLDRAQRTLLIRPVERSAPGRREDTER